MLVEWEDGAELSRSRRKPGGYSPLTRDGDKRLGQVVLSDVDWDEEDRVAPNRQRVSAPAAPVLTPRSHEEGWAAAIVDLIGELSAPFIDAGVDAVATHAERCWNDRTRPTVTSTTRSIWNKFAATRRARRRAQGAVLDAATPVSTMVRMPA